MKTKNALWVGVLCVAVIATGVALRVNGNNSAMMAAQAADGASKTPAVTIDVKAALAPRSVGNPKAPVTMDEYASLSCPHCAEFSKETFEKIKTDYIDTGKVYFTYHDFPLNASALEGSMVARCLPPESYFPFIALLFQTQDQWAYSPKYQDALRQNAKLLGVDDAHFDACINNGDLKQGLADGMKEATDKNKINSTPTFIIDGMRVISGALPFEEFKKALDDALAKKG